MVSSRKVLTFSFLGIWLLCAYGAYEAYRYQTQMLYVWVAAVLVLPFVFQSMLNTEINYVLSPAERYRQDEGFKRRVENIEEKYQGKPNALRNTTVFLALLGYLVVLSVVVLTLVMGGGIALLVQRLFGQWYYTLAAVVPFTWFAFKLVWPLIRPVGGDRGVELKPKDAPRLFGLLRKIEKRGKGKRFERVFVDMEMNASVSRSGGIKGLFGFGPVTLNLGLPLMQALSVNQLAGVLAHEYGHVAGNHNALAHWVYRIRQNWLHIGEDMHKEELWHLLQFSRLYRFFIKHFKAYSFVLSRQCEYEADEFAAKVAGVKNITESLVAIESKAQHLYAEFWKDVWKLANTYPEPSGSPYRIMGDFLKTCDVQDDIHQLPKKEADVESTHPPLHQRVEALGGELHRGEPLDVSAATRLLGEGFEFQLVAVFDKFWAQQNKRKWRAQFRRYQSALKVVQDTPVDKVKQLPDHELIGFVNAAHTIEDYDSVIAGCEEMLARDPKNGSAKVNMLGYGLVHNQKEINLLKLDELIGTYPEYLPQASMFALRYLNERGRFEEAKIYQYRLDDWEYKYQAAEEERSHIFAKDVFSYHSISPEYVRRIADILSEHEVVKKAWVVRKEVSYFKDSKPLFVVVLKHGVFTPKDKVKILRKIEKSFYRAAMPPIFRFFWLDDYKYLKTKIKKVKEALVYRR